MTQMASCPHNSICRNNRSVRSSNFLFNDTLPRSMVHDLLEWCEEKIIASYERKQIFISPWYALMSNCLHPSLSKLVKGRKYGQLKCVHGDFLDVSVAVIFEFERTLNKTVNRHSLEQNCPNFCLVLNP